MGLKKSGVVANNLVIFGDYEEGDTTNFQYLFLYSLTCPSSSVTLELLEI